MEVDCWIASWCFLVFVVFAWFLVQAFSNRMLNTESDDVNRSMTTVARRLERESDRQLNSTDIDNVLRPNQADFNSVVNDPVIHEIARSDYDLIIYDNHGKQVYPEKPTNVAYKPVKKSTISLEKVNHSKQMIGRQPLVNRDGHATGYLVVEIDSCLITKHSRKSFQLLLSQLFWD
ncbi:Uncharacterised protein [Weissella viridescens]|uniref:ArlS sensor domain-containing protein n=1 Tax=Weissella viridescens TaxID=1629 RepID=A0A380P181_WEIVI|nr:Uncharacterised protein [Weissella viridescens]